MDITIPYLRSQSDLLAEIKVLTRVGSSARWSDAEYYAALNQVLMSWADKVKMPHVYTISGGWVAGTYEYALPGYVRPPLYPELLRIVPFDNYVSVTQTSHWQDIVGYETISDGAGGQVLRFISPPRSVQGQVGFYSPNSRVPTTIPTTSGSTTSTATTMTIGSAIEISDVGYVKCESEWLAYYGVTRGASTTVLNNLVHALYGTTAATHNTGTSVYWGVAVDTPELWRVLMDQWKGCLAELFLQDGGTHERAPYQQNLGFYSQVAANFFATYNPPRKSTGVRLNQKIFAFR